MKKHFSRGLALLLPIVLTLLIFGTAIDFLTRPFLEMTEHLLDRFPLFEHGDFPHRQGLLLLASQLLILLSLIASIFLVGVIGDFVLIETFFRYADSLLHQVPLINKVYRISQQVIRNLFCRSSKKFTHVVLAPFPHSDAFCFGLVANDSLTVHYSPSHAERYCSVFLPGTPNPSCGYLLLYKKEELVCLDMKVDEAVKIILSCAVAPATDGSSKPQENNKCFQAS